MHHILSYSNSYKILKQKLNERIIM